MKSELPTKCDRDQSVQERLRSLRRQMTVEPIIFFNFLALSLLKLANHSVLYRSVCLQETRSSPQICARLDQHPEMEDEVQREASKLNMYISLAYLLPAIPSGIFLAAWSDRNGRQVSILIGFAGLIVSSMAWMGLATFPYMPFYVLIVANAVAGFCGYIAIIMISTMAYLSDLVADKSRLTFRMIILSLARSVADVIGSFSSGSLFTYFGASRTMLISHCCLAVGFFYTLLMIRQVPPALLTKLSAKDKQSAKAIEAAGVVLSDEKKIQIPAVCDKKSGSKQEESDSTTLQTRRCGEFLGLLRYIGRMYDEVWRTVTKRRPNGGRSYMLLGTLIYFLYMMIEVSLMHGPIMSLYVFHRPFSWTPAELGLFNGVNSVCGLVGVTGGALLERRFGWSSVSIMLVSLVSSICHMVLTGLARNDWMLYLALVTGSLSGLLWPALKSLMISLVEPQEVGKALAANGVAADLAFVTSTLLFTTIYRWTVAVFPGAVFLICAFGILVCLGCTLWIRYDTSRRRRRMVVDAAKLDSDPPTVATVQL